MQQPARAVDADRVPTPGRARLILVLVVLEASALLARLAFPLWSPPGAPRQRPDLWSDFLFYGPYAAAYLCAGLLIDHFGLKRVVGLALIGWCGLVMTGGLLIDPLSLAAIHLPVILVYAITDVAPFVVVKRGVRSGATALAVAIPTIASFLWGAAAEPMRVSLSAGAPTGQSSERMWIALVCMTLGACITLIWLTVYRGPDRIERPGLDSPIARLAVLLADRKLWGLLVLTALGAILFKIGEHRLFRYLELERNVSERTVGIAFDYPYLAAILGALGAAVWSDRILRDSGSLVAARRPFIVAGFALCVALGLVPLVRQTDLIAMASIAALGLGIRTLVSVVVIDIAPSGCTGTFSGIVLACDSLVRFGFAQVVLPLYRPAHSYVPVLTVGAVVGVVGAVAAFRLLRRIEPIPEPGDARPDVASLFS